MRVRLVSALALLFVLHAAVASAQQTQSAGVFGAGGVVFQKAFYDSPKAGSTVGPTLGFQIRTGRAGAAAFTFELMAQPLPVRIRRPGYEDSFAPFYAMAGVEIGRRTYVRVSVGLTTVTSMLPMLGLAMGFERGTGPTLLSGAEFVLRAGGSARAIGAIAGIHLRLGARTQPAAK